MQISDKAIDKFTDKLELSREVDGHWVWLASTGTGRGHGRFWDGQRFWVAHRFAWAMLHGDIPDGVQIWNTCGVDRCVRPAHHEALTDDAARSRMSAAYTLDRDTCKYGHAWTKKNTHISPRGLKVCRACGRNYQRWLRFAKPCGRSWQEWNDVPTR